MNPFNNLTIIDTDQKITVIDEHRNSYTGHFIWDSEEEIHKLDEYKIVADYEKEKVYIVKPIEDEKISGFLSEIIEIKM